MNRFVKFVILTLIVTPGVMTTGAPSESAAQGKRRTPGGKFNGVPRDVDFIKNLGWSQVIVQGKEPMSELIAQTKNDRIQSILLAALSLKSEVVVEYVEDKPNPKMVTSVNLPVKAKEQQGHVFAMSFNEKDNYCRATVFDQSKKVNVWTKSAQMQGILETAVRQSIPVQEFAFDAKTLEITRGKVNVELRK
jgi:hypothetical protein